MSALSTHAPYAEPGFTLAMSFQVRLFASGDLKAVEFVDAADFAEAKNIAITAVSTLAADHAEVHDDCVGLVFHYPQPIS